MVPCEVVGVRLDQAVGSPVLRLRETSGSRREFDIYIGAPEAAAIHTALEGVELPRPLTHDLFVLVLERLEVSVKQVAIVKVVEGTYFAEITLSTDRGVYDVSCRPSDGVAIAVRCGAPVVVAPEIIDAIGETPGEPVSDEIIEEFRDFIDNINPEDFGG